MWLLAVYFQIRVNTLLFYLMWPVEADRLKSDLWLFFVSGVKTENRFRTQILEVVVWNASVPLDQKFHSQMS